MSGSRKKDQPQGRHAATTPLGGSLSIIEQVADLAWAGQQQQAIELATVALAAPDVRAAQRLALLDLYAESRMAQGDFAGASADAVTMRTLANRAKSAGLRALALNRQTRLQWSREADDAAAVKTATHALAEARRSGEPELHAMSLLLLADAQSRDRSRRGAALANSVQASALFEALEQPAEQGRAYRIQADVLWRLGRTPQDRVAADRGLNLAKASGDLLGQGRVLFLLPDMTGDMAAQLRLWSQSVVAFKALAHLPRYGHAVSNLAGEYRGLGLYRQARRLAIEANRIGRKIKDADLVWRSSWGLFDLEILLGNVAAARTYAAQAEVATGEHQHPRAPLFRILTEGTVAMAERRAADAARYFESAVQPAKSADKNMPMYCQTESATAHIANRRVLALQTGKWGMSSRDTESPAEALRWLGDVPGAGEAFDLAILDMHMPEMDGLELARRIRTHHAALPLVLFSSLGRREGVEAESLFSAYLAKPIRQSHLFDTLASLLAHDPAAKPAARAPSHAAGKAQLDPGMAARHPLRILLAGDNVVNQKLALRLLQQMGYRADLASNGIEAVESVQRQPYDVVLMDVQMPELDGLDATRQTCALLPADARPRIVAMTASAMQGDREMCLVAGMDDYLTKPIRVERLVEALNHANARGIPP